MLELFVDAGVLFAYAGVWVEDGTWMLWRNSSAAAPPPPPPPSPTLEHMFRLCWSVLPMFEFCFAYAGVMFAYAGVVSAYAGVWFRLGWSFSTMLEFVSPMLKCFTYAGVGFAHAEVVRRCWSFVLPMLDVVYGNQKHVVLRKNHRRIRRF